MHNYQEFKLQDIRNTLEHKAGLLNLADEVTEQAVIDQVIIKMVN